MCTGRPTHTPGEEATTPAYRAARHGHRCRRAVLALALVATLAAAGPDAADPPYGNAVTHWNAVASEVFVPTQGTNPLAQSRTFAILHAAVHDVLNTIDRRFEPYTRGVAAAPDASVDAAVAAAAREVLIALVPDQTLVVDAAYERILTKLQDGPPKAAGIAAGQACARATLARRQRDGFDAVAQPVTWRGAVPGSTSSRRHSMSRCSRDGVGWSRSSSTCRSMPSTGHRI